MQNNNLPLLNSIVDDLTHRGYSIQPNALPNELGLGLYDYINNKTTADLKQAGIGRNDLHAVDQKIRSDHIEWIDGKSSLEKNWLDWIDELRSHINRRLFLGLERFESHYAYYPKGAFYQRHRDAFVGQSNRILSLVTYLNAEWCVEQGGELILYRNDNDAVGKAVLPAFGTLVLFLSEEFPHEVCTATRDRYSIAGWFRARSE